MSEYGIVQQHLSTLEMDGKPFDVSVRIAYDGIEYIGRLFFSDPATGHGSPDHGAIPGRTVEEGVSKIDLPRFLELASKQANGEGTFQTLADLDGMVIAGPAEVSAPRRSGGSPRGGARRDPRLRARRPRDLWPDRNACQSGSAPARV